MPNVRNMLRILQMRQVAFGFIQEGNCRKCRQCQWLKPLPEIITGAEAHKVVGKIGSNFGNGKLAMVASSDVKVRWEIPLIPGPTSANFAGSVADSP